MTAVMEGVRILEVADHTFVPAASALLADWGAEVIKVEHVERGDAMRGLAQSGIAVVGGPVHVLLEHSNRGKKSLGLDLASEAGQEVLAKLIATSDVFLTNKVGKTREKLSIDVDSVRKHNPDIIYVRGSGQGERGPEAERGSYDQLAYWCRSGVAMALKAPEDDFIPPPPAPAFGDSIGAMTIAGGIMGALFHRERSGETTIVDVSLLSAAIWSMGAAMALSLQFDMPWSSAGMRGGGSTGNPLVGNYKASDDRWIALTCLQAGQYWPEFCELVGRPELAADGRFDSAEGLRENAADATGYVVEIFAERTSDEWRELLERFSGQWAMVQNTIEAANDPQSVANGYISELATADGTPFKLATAPVQFDEEPAWALRAPEFNEHGDDILGELGYDWDTIVDLKVKGVVA